MLKIATCGPVREIQIDSRPVNALGAAVRKALFDAVDAAEADPDIRAIVIRGADRHFSGGADISEFNKPLADPSLPDLLDRIERATKPVVAAIDGVALGGGLELAMACHYRIATPQAKLGLPEVTLGLLPGAGGTQRLPRLVGAECALQIIVSGVPISGEEAREAGVVDALASAEELAQTALSAAAKLNKPGRVRDKVVTADAALFEKFERELSGKNRLDAVSSCIAAVRAASELPFDDGQRVEQALFATLLESDQSKALRHIFFAERAAAKIDDLPNIVKPRAIHRVGVVGAGTMGGGIAMNFLSAGIAVTLIETAEDALQRGTAVMRKNYDSSAAKGRISADQVDRAMALLTTSLDFARLGDCDLIIEAVYENMDLKKDIFARLDAVAKPDAILASNTSFLDVDAIAAATSRPGSVLGLHFFSPANVMKLLEVVRGAKTAPDVLATAMGVARKIGKTPVVSGVCYGFIGNRMLIPRQDQAAALLLQGATPEQIDRVHTEFGMPMGPFQMMDLAGVDIGWHRDPTRAETIAEALCAQNRWGQKTSAGYYDYDDRRRPSPSPVTQGVIEQFRAAAGIEPRAVSDEEIVVRTLYTMVNEAAHILDEGIAQRASDIDVVWVHGYGWPRWRGGPMFWADSVGADEITRRLKDFKAELGPDFKLSRLLETMPAGARFTSPA